MSWGAIGAAGIGAAAGYLGSDEDKVRVMDGIPDFAKQDYKDLISQIPDLQSPEYYQGSTLARNNLSQQGYLHGLRNYGLRAGDEVRRGQMDAGRYGLEAMGGGLDYLNQMAGQDALGYNQSVFDKSFGNLMPGLQGAFDAATRDINRNLNWNQLPGIDMSAAMSGQMGSTKQGQASALAQGMAADRAADVGSQLWMNAANQAHQAAMDQTASSNLIGGYQNYAATGLPQYQQTYNTGMQNIENLGRAGDLQQYHAQQLIDHDKARWDYEQQQPWIDLGNKLTMMTTNLPQNPNAGRTFGTSGWEGAIQGANAGLNFYNAYNQARNPGGGWTGQPQNTVNTNPINPGGSVQQTGQNTYGWTPPPGYYDPRNG